MNDIEYYEQIFFNLFLKEKTQEELREYINPYGKLNYFGTQKVLNDYCNKWNILEEESYLYVLILESNIFYIGETVQFFKRMCKHFSLNDKNYVDIELKYPAKSVYEVIPLKDADKRKRLLYEDALTMEYVNKYGIYNVRGGRFSNPDINIAFDMENFKNQGFQIRNGKIYTSRQNVKTAIRNLKTMEKIHPVLSNEES